MIGRPMRILSYSESFTSGDCYGELGLLMASEAVYSFTVRERPLLANGSMPSLLLVVYRPISAWYTRP